MYSELQTAEYKGRNRARRSRAEARSSACRLWLSASASSATPQQTTRASMQTPVSLPENAAPQSRPLSTAVWSSLHIYLAEQMRGIL
ncbi:hypothetical protein Y032_0045g1231 [Ancylostoma ceylanicum]|uniref:Uncharacterized protein n=1 Tax=Ancylostoma ceylanicum TaxID=53326 RepID=A0A016UDZ2_9BILA|nr:hypothetical protein Y032_0045g1231 [Ancylostoma ceylanicum]